MPSPLYLKASDAEIWQKFQTINAREIHALQQTTSIDSKYSTAPATSLANENRNRYTNIMTYAYNRVLLDCSGNDYINASRIVLNTPQSIKPSKYIATQGPTFDTFPQFWEMCYQSEASEICVVMLTPLVEGHREKCYRYWPQTAEQSLHIPARQRTDKFDTGSVFYTGLTVSLLSKHRSTDDSYTLSRLKLVPDDDSKSTKFITHFYFDKWQDLDAPTQTGPVLHLLQRVHNIYTSLSPLIVHCSAGVGRTGTFIALDHLLHYTKEFVNAAKIGDEYDTIENVVMSLRYQRMRSVQMESQYAFIYRTCRRFLQQANNIAS